MEATPAQSRCLSAGETKRAGTADKGAPPAKRGKKAAAEKVAAEKAAEPKAAEEAPAKDPKEAQEYPELPEDRMIACAMLQCRVGHDRLLAGAELPSLANGPILQLPLVHPMTGWVPTPPPPPPKRRPLVAELHDLS